MLPLKSALLPLLIALPGLCVFLLYKNGRSIGVTESVSYALSLSLLMAPASATILFFLNVNVAFTGVLIGSIILTLSLLSFVIQGTDARQREVSGDADSSRRRTLMLAIPILFSLALAVLVSVPLAKSLVVSNDGLMVHPTEASDLNFHLSIIARFVESPHIPPEDPYLPMYYIIYNWFMHVDIGTLSILSGISPLVIIKLLVPLLVFTLSMNVFVLCKKVFDNLTALSAMVLYTLGGGLTWIAITYARPSDVFPYLIYQFSDAATIKYDQTLLFYLLPQTQSFALVILTFAFILWVTLIKDLKVLNALLFGLALGFLSYYHVITAFPLFVAVGVYTAYKYMKKDVKCAKYNLSSLLVGCAIALPQLLLLIIGGPTQAEITFSTYSLDFVFLIYGLVGVLAAIGAYRSLRNEAAKPLIAFGLCAFLAMNVIALPLTDNSYRFLVFLYLPVAIFASFYIATVIRTLKSVRRSSRATLVSIGTIAIALFLAFPTSYMMWQFYDNGAYVLASRDELQALQWAKGNTSKDAIFLEEPAAFPRVPLETGRRLAFAGPLYTMQYHGVDLQKGIDTLMNERDPRALALGLKQINVSYVFIGPREQHYQIATTVRDTRFFESVFVNPTVTIYKVKNDGAITGNSAMPTREGSNP